MKTCDLVMKGGIASGIVYPEAVVELSKEFAFQGIGGTSAGAIAAAATAAAEYRRLDQEHPPDWVGLEPLLEISRYMATEGNLKRLFRPQSGILGWAFHTLLAVQRLPVSPVILLGLVGLGYFLGSSYLAQYLGRFNPLIAGAILVAPLLLGYLLANHLLSAFRANRYGFCKGCGSSEQFTPWLYSTTQRLSGLDERTPLTFGHLRDRGIRFRLVTTNLNHGRPYQFPSSRATLYYRSEEMREYFPKSVVDWMDRDNPEESGFRKLPVGDRLPIIVPTRISSSFPALFSAVPLYAKPFDRAMDDGMGPAGKGTPLKDDQLQPELCLFADGGICSNLPVHFFDSPLPEHPTFAINLDSFAPGFEPHSDEAKNVRRAKTNKQFSSYECWNRFDNLGGWLYSIFNAAQNWRDNGLVRKPGYRDRVVHITLAGSEGGLNLDMDPKLIERLQKRGKAAGQTLLAGFGKNSTDRTNWANHRWIRYRNTMKLLASMLPEVRDRLEEPRYSELFTVDRGQPPSYRFHYDERQQPLPPEVSARRVAELRESSQALCKLLKDWQPASAFSITPPHPEIQLGINPELETETK